MPVKKYDTFRLIEKEAMNNAGLVQLHAYHMLYILSFNPHNNPVMYYY